jgi:hypothetical protein
MVIFKLIFEHDMVLEQLSKPGTRYVPPKTSSLDDFLKPQQTYSRMYLSATNLEKQIFGLNHLPRFDEAIKSIDGAIGATNYVRSDGKSSAQLSDLVSDASESMAIVAAMNTIEPQIMEAIAPGQGLRDRLGDLVNILDKNHIVIFFEKAHNGLDLHIFSKNNIYDPFFYAFRKHMNKDYRFFSINGKKAKSERLFYFETWSLNRPPHGFEEVTEQTVYR